MLEFWKNISPHLISGGLRLLGALAIVIVGWILIKWLEGIVRKGKLFGKMEATARIFLINVISVALKVVLILTAVATLGVNMTGLVTLLGSCGIAIGLALQGSLSNFAGGILILLCHPFRVGDYIEVGDKSGTVKSISILYTTLTTIDNRNVVIPNGALSNATVVNYSSEDLRRVDLDFSVAYGTDTDRVKKVLLLISDQHPMVLKDPAPFARLTANDDSALNFTLRAWVKKEDYWQVRFDLLEQVNDAFRKVGIEIPFPQV
ncbi:MAG: mechanosensitive ion channel family protein, partial [Clostridia bacterium]|nr:mechanosensitive ion channel family protein [Clostridia bacterium]